MEKVYKEDPLNTRNLFYFARENMYYKKFDKAIQLFNNYIEVSSFAAEITEAYFLLWECYKELSAQSY